MLTCKSFSRVCKDGRISFVITAMMRELEALGFCFKLLDEQSHGGVVERNPRAFALAKRFRLDARRGFVVSAFGKCIERKNPRPKRGKPSIADSRLVVTAEGEVANHGEILVRTGCGWRSTLASAGVLRRCS